MRKPKTIRARTKLLLSRKRKAAVGQIEFRPNAQTKRALREVRARKNLETFATFSEWAKSVREL
jgi:hypothetical protein